MCQSEGTSPVRKNVLFYTSGMKIKTIALLGKKGGVCKDHADIPLIIPSDTTARIQEIHILIEILHLKKETDCYHNL